jgi:hypothetical protein
MTKTQAQTDIIADLQDSIDNLSACKDDSYVLAFSNGLGIRFIEPGKPVACALWMADAIVTRDQAQAMPEEAWGYTPIVKNGAGVQASLVPRQAAIAREIENLKGLIAYLSK